PDPPAKWRHGNCNMATHLQATAQKGNGKLNPLKASKRRAA
ncbi:MAG: PxxKW family cysteine-rich protein, partial [Desulfobacteraceae bacterium]